MTDRSHPKSERADIHEWIIESLINIAAYADKYGLNQLHDRLADVVCEAATGELAQATRTLIDRKYLSSPGASNVVPFGRESWGKQ